VCKRGTLQVVAGKGQSRMRQNSAAQQPQRPPTPPVDPDNEEFVVFVRAKKLPRWIPFTIVKGGAQANVLVKAMKGNFGKEFYSKTLINQIGQVSAASGRCVDRLGSASAACERAYALQLAGSYAWVLTPSLLPQPAVNLQGEGPHHRRHP